MLTSIAALLLASCSPIVDTLGHPVDHADLEQLVPGQAGPEDVQAVLGSPSVRSIYGPETWYYLTARKETVGPFAPELADQETVVVHFDEAQKLKDIEFREKEDSLAVGEVRKTTPTEGNRLSFIEQLVGNLGRFNTPSRGVDPRNLGR